MVTEIARRIRAFTVHKMCPIECPPVVNNIPEDVHALITGQTLSSTEGTIRVDAVNIYELYTDLTLAKIKDKAYGNEMKSISNYRELFTCTNKVSVKRKFGEKILLKGDPWSGKTTICKKVAFDWATGELNDFYVVFFIPLKLLKEYDTVESIIRDQHPFLEEKRITKQNVRDILEGFGSKLLLILDGFNELVDRQTQNSDVMELIKGQKLMQSNIILTSRPHVTQKIEQYFDTIVQVTGFSLPHAKKYSTQVLASSQKAETVLQFYQYGCNRDKRIHFNPMILSVLCVLIGHDESFISPVEIYMRLVTVLYLIYARKNDLLYGRSEFLSVVKSIGTIAWNVLKSANQFLTRADVLRVVGPDAFSYGLLVGYEDFRLVQDETADIVVSFVHPSVQQILAAFSYVLALNNGDDCHIRSVKQSIMLNSPLFLSFCLWFCTKIRLILHVQIGTNHFLI